MAVRLMKTMFMLTLAAWAVLNGWHSTEAHHAVVRFNLEDMEATADRIFLGRCVNVEATEAFIAQGMMSVTHYTFEVEAAYKGKLHRRYTFTQLGHPARAAFKETGLTMHGQTIKPGEFIHGMSSYEVGDRMLLFLTPNYMNGKLTYPVGLYQGAFLISEMPSGSVLARNSINNAGLFDAPYGWSIKKETDAKIIFPSLDEPLQNVSPEAQTLINKRGALPLNAMLKVVDRITATHGRERGSIIQGANIQ
ncbi:MAG: hypothetical protein AB1757_20820 [Acidobacteriota bacterium]